MTNRDLPSRPIALFAAAVVALIGICLVVSLGVLHVAKRSAATATESTGADDSRPGAPPPPAVRLQVTPRTELAALARDKVQVLHSYAWVDRRAGQVRIPIAVAIALAAQRGLPVFDPLQKPAEAAAPTTPKEP